MVRYGNIHALSDFVEKTMPRRSGAPDLTFTNLVLAGLKRMDAAQQTNGQVTLTVSTGGGIWVTHAGVRYLMIIRTKTSLRVLTDEQSGPLATVLDKAARLSPSAVKDTTGDNLYRQWNVFAEGLETLWHFIENLPKP